MFHDSDSVSYAADGEEPVTVRPREFDLRPDQWMAWGELRDRVARRRRPVYVLPTGGGKTIVAAKLIHSLQDGRKIWFLTHLRQLIAQTTKVLTAYGIPHGVIADGYPSNPDEPIQIVSIPSVSRGFSGDGPDLAIWDECMHIAAAGWAGLFRQFGDIPQVGLSATPERLDGKGLSDFFDELILGPSTKELIGKGHLASFKYFAPTTVDLSEARTSMGEYHRGDVAQIMNRSVVIGDVVTHYQRYAAGKTAVAFAWDLESSRRIVDRFNEAGIPAAHLDGNSLDDERQDVLGKLERREIMVVSNYGLFPEGFDLPSIGCVILMRPTKSTALDLQMCGRGLRKGGDEPKVILDHAGLCYDHGLPSDDREWTLDGKAKARWLARRLVEGKATIRECPSCSQVFSERVLVCDHCGYEFAAGRDIGEHDGELVEITNIAPEGCETKADFGRRTGYGSDAITRYCQRGMPMINGFVVIEPALKWLEENAGSRHYKKRNGYMTPKEVSNQHGVPYSTVLKWVKKDRVENWNGLIKVDSDSLRDVLNEYAENRKAFRKPENHEDTIPPFEFANMVGKKVETIYSWRKKGLPHADNGWIIVKPAIQWIDEWLSVPNVNRGVDGFVSRTAAAKELGVTTTAISNWATMDGFPKCAENGWVRLNEVKEWERDRFWSGYDRRDCETQTAFCARLRISKSRFVRRIRDNVIITGNGSVVIKPALEWVRDNTNIKIPPEAWPKEEDGGDQND